MGEPELPYTQDELDKIMARPPHLRMVNPWLCAYNLRAEDGIGDYAGMGYRQCPIHLADPTRSRYCLDHSRALGVDFYSPSEVSEVTAKETAASLTRLVPKAVKTLETVMDDADAPATARARAGEAVLDRTGYRAGVDVKIEGRLAVVDVSAVLTERLDALRDAQKAVDEDRAELAGLTPELTAEVIDVTDVVEPSASSDDGAAAPA
jgi:hypothetical protein